MGINRGMCGHIGLGIKGLGFSLGTAPTQRQSIIGAILRALYRVFGLGLGSKVGAMLRDI